jgi:Tfp pilus assembly protein PilF
MYQLAKIEVREKNFAAALPLLEDALLHAPDQEAVHFLLARVCQALGQHERAQAAFNEVRRLQRERLERQMAGGAERAVIGEDLGEGGGLREPR